jgi:hypothetical protein
VSAQDGGEAVARRLAALAHEELALVEDGRHDRLAEVDERRSAALQLLPQQLSPPAREALVEAVDVQRRTAAELTTRMALAREELGRLRRGSAAMAGYRPAGYDARPLLDRSA